MDEQTSDRSSSDKNKFIISAVFLLAVGAGFLFWQRGADQKAGKTAVISEGDPSSRAVTFFSDPRRSAHHEGNTPGHGAVLAGAPFNVAIDFNFDLADNSEILSIKLGEREYASGPTVVDPGRLAMRRKMDAASPDGLYDVVYRACWADGSCHDGQFQFAIDRKRAENFSDLRSQEEIIIALQGFAFSPKEVRISRGTKVTWINKDPVVHTVNTDSHPFHTYFLPQNSRDLRKDETFSVTFDEPGIYPYHCSPHARNMVGTILVE